MLGGAELALTLGRAVWLAGALSAAGALLFAATEAGPDTYRHRLRRLVAGSLCLATLGWAGWVTQQAAAFADTWEPDAVAGLLPEVLDTVFGRAAVAQLVLLAAAVGVSCTGRDWARWPAAMLALGAVGLQVAHLHAWAMRGPSLLAACALLHVLAAAAWLGGLLPLRLLILSVSPGVAAAASRRFSRRALVAVCLVAAGALGQGWVLLGGWAGLGTGYGRTALLKAGLFAVLLLLAARNRFRLTPALARPDPAPARRALLTALVAESAIGLVVVLLATLLSAQPPAADTATEGFASRAHLRHHG